MNIADSIRSVLLARFPVFEQVPTPMLDTLLAAAAPRRLPIGTVLFDKNMPCEGFPLVLEGGVRVSTTSASGREIVLYRVGPGEGCVLSGGCLLGHSDYSARGVTESEVLMLKLPPAAFEQLMIDSSDFRRFVFDMYGARLAEVMELVEEVAFRKLDTRLARLLVQRGPVLETTHQAIADELGSVRVFISRVLRNFEERGWVKLDRERVTVVDPRALQSFSQQ